MLNIRDLESTELLQPLTDQEASTVQGGIQFTSLYGSIRRSNFSSIYYPANPIRPIYIPPTPI